MSEYGRGEHKNTGFVRIVKAGGYSICGMRSAWLGEAAFRQECLLALLTVPCVFLVDASSVQRSLIVCATFLVLIVELLNSGIEAVVDRIGTEHHELSGMAKDMGSAAVFLSLLLWAYVWLECIFA